MGTVCWARGPAGPLDLLLDELGFFRSQEESDTVSTCFSEEKGRERSLIVQVKFFFLSKSEHAPDAWTIGDGRTFKHLLVLNSQLGNRNSPIHCSATKIHSRLFLLLTKGCSKDAPIALYGKGGIGHCVSVPRLP